MNNLRIDKPKTLYRYRPLAKSWANTLSEITGMLWLSKSEGLNDPFDGLGYSPSYVSYLRDKVNGRGLKLRKIWSVACFTTKWDNPTMWAHYANNYTGICLGYDKTKLDKHVDNIISDLNNPAFSISGVFLKPMSYRKTMPKSFKSEEEPLTIKTIHWNYEDEWRLGIMKSYGNSNEQDLGARHYIKDAISEIIYTDKLTMNELLAIKSIVKESNQDIKLFKISIEKGIKTMKREEIV